MPRPTSRRVGEHARRADERDESDGEQAERPPVVAAERAHLLAPPIGDSHAGHALTSRTPLASTVPSMFPMPLTRKASAEDRGGEAARSARGRGELTVTAATPANTMPKRADRDAGHERAGRRLPGRDPGQAQRPASDDVGADRDDEGGGEAGMPADDGGADQLGAPRLLVLPGVAHDGERAHQRGQHREHADSRGS